MFGGHFIPFLLTLKYRASLMTVFMSLKGREFGDEWGSSVAVSACSLPSILQRPGIQEYVIFLPCRFAMKWVLWIFLKKSEGVYWFWKLVKAERDSLNIVIFLSFILEMVYSIALRIASASAEYIEHFFKSFYWIVVSLHIMAISTSPSMKEVTVYRWNCGWASEQLTLNTLL